MQQPPFDNPNDEFNSENNGNSVDKNFNREGNDGDKPYQRRYDNSGDGDKPYYKKPYQDRGGYGNNSYGNNRNYGNNSYNRGGYNNNRGEGGYNKPRTEGGYNNNRGEGGYNKPRTEGGYNNNRSEGGYNKPRTEGGYNNNRTGGYNNRNEGGGYNRSNNYNNRSEGGYNNRTGGYNNRGEGGGYNRNSYNNRSEGNVGGYNNRTEGGSYNNRTEGGGYNNRTEGGNYNNRTEGGGYNNRTEGGGYNNNRSGGYNNNRGGGGGYNNRGGSGGYNNRGGGGGYNNRGGGGGYNNRGGGGGYNNRGGSGGYGNNRGGGGGFGGRNRMQPRTPLIIAEPLNNVVPQRDELPDVIRLNRFVAKCGICARRDADDLIREGRVKVNGQVVTQMGTKVNVLTDLIEYEGKQLTIQHRIYILYNKPKNVICTTNDELGRTTVVDMISDATQERVYPVGRLDRDTTGLILLTNDGDLTEKLTHPSHRIRKRYHVSLDRIVNEEDFIQLKKGVELEDGLSKVDKIEHLMGKPENQVMVEIHSGKNHIIRRTFDAIGANVVGLDRVMIASLGKKGLPRGKWRMLSEQEIGYLKMLDVNPDTELEELPTPALEEEEYDDDLSTDF